MLSRDEVCCHCFHPQAAHLQDDNIRKFGRCRCEHSNRLKKLVYLIGQYGGCWVRPRCECTEYEFVASC